MLRKEEDARVKAKKLKTRYKQLREVRNVVLPFHEEDEFLFALTGASATPCA